MFRPNIGLAKKTGEVDSSLREAGTNRQRRRGRRATRAQIVAIHGLATRHGVDLDGLLRDRFQVCQLYELSAPEVGELLGELQAMSRPIS